MGGKQSAYTTIGHVLGFFAAIIATHLRAILRRRDYMNIGLLTIVQIWVTLRTT